MKSWIVAATAALSLAASAGWAAVYFNWNDYVSWFEPSVVDLADSATTIDFVRIERTDKSVVCPRWNWDFTREEQRAYLEQRRAIPGCDNGHSGPLPGTFDGVVIERLKGRSADKFALDWVWEGRTYGFSDPAHHAIEREEGMEQYVRQEADTRHAELSFWSNPTSHFARDMTDSAGGDRTLDPTMTYIVFRDDAGNVIAMEPAWADDELARRLRLKRANPAFDIRDEMSVMSWFDHVTELALVRIDTCAGQGEFHAKNEIGVVSPLRGNPAFITQANDRRANRDYTAHSLPSDGASSPPEGSLAVNDLPDFYEWRGQPCAAPGSLILIMNSGLYGEIPPLLVVPVSPDGRINRADIPTALRLTGPETFTVDQAFQWFEVERVIASSPVPSSS